MNVVTTASAFQRVSLNRGSRFAPAAPAARQAVRRTGLMVRAEAMDGVGKFFKKLQGSIPIVSVISRLTADDGGFDECLSYQEFSRKIFNDSPFEYSVALDELVRRHGEYGSQKNVNFCLWMAVEGTGRVLDKVIVLSARRVRFNNDLDYEVGRFLAMREEEVTRYKYMDFKPTVEAMCSVAVASLAECICGIKEDGVIPAEDAAPISEIVGRIIPGATPEGVQAIVEKRNGGGVGGGGGGEGGAAVE